MWEDFSSKESFKEAWCNRVSELPGLNMSKEQAAVVFNEYYEDPDISIYNSHRNFTKRYSMLKFFETVYKEELILIENGRMFYNQNKILPPSVKITEDLIVDRKTIKKQSAISFEKGMIQQAQLEDRQQLIIKVDGNTFYGIMNNPYAKYFNLDVGGSVTCAGRHGIALCALICEMTMGTYIHRNIEAVLHQFNSILMEEYNEISLSFLEGKNITKDMVVSKYSVGMEDNKEFVEVIRSYVNKLDSLSISKLYYKNNMKLFISDISNDDRYRRIFSGINSNYNDMIGKVGTNYNGKDIRIMDAVYSDPFHYPKFLAEAFEELRILVKDILYGYYWYGGDYVETAKIMTTNMADTISIMERNVILLVDTDSNMVLIDDMVQEMLDKFSDTMPSMSDDYKWISASSMINYFISVISDIGMTKYKYARNILPEYHKYMHIKNEFLYSDFIITSRKKNYIALMRVKEGSIFEEPKLDIKGLSIKKAGFNDTICEIVENIIEKDILNGDMNNININGILETRKKTFDKMTKALRSNNAIEYFTVLKLGSDLSNFDRGEHRVKAIRMWNLLYGDIETIIPPSSFYVAPLDIDADMLRNDSVIYRKLCVELLKTIKYVNIEKQMYRYCETIPMILTDNKAKYTDSAVKKVNAISIDIPENIVDTYDLDFFIEEKYKEICKTRKEIEEEIFPQLQGICNLYKKENPNTKDNDLKFIMKVKRMEKYKSLATNNKLNINKYFVKIAIPKSITDVPDLIKNHINTEPYLSTFDNLLAPVLTEIGQVGIRMDSGRVCLTDVVKYF